MKWYVWNKVQGRKANVKNAESFAQAEKSMPNVVYNEMTTPNIEILLNDMNFHQLIKESAPVAKKYDGNSVTFYLSKECQNLAETRLSDAKDGPEDIQNTKVKDWAVVNYYDMFYLGEAKAIEQGEFLVSVMVPAGANCKWPCNIGMPYCTLKIIRRISVPVPVNGRGHSYFADILPGAAM